MKNRTPHSTAPGSIVGKSLPRVDAFEKATGLGLYTGDIRLPHMLHGLILRSPQAHARILAIHTERAESIPGVRAVLTSLQATRKPFNAAARENVLDFPPVQPVEDQHLFDHKVRFIGDPVAAVAAVSREAAQQAVQAIQVSYEPLPALFHPEEAMAPTAPLLHEGMKNNLLARISRRAGDPEQALETSDERVENTYSTSRQKHCQMEPNACVAAYDGRGRLTVWSPTQMPHLVRRMLAMLFDLPLHKVQILSPLIGGGFGNRLGMVVEPYAAALAMKTRGVVRIEYDRQEDFSGSESRHPSMIRVQMGGNRKGFLQAVQVKATLNTGAYATHGPGVLGVVANSIPGPYRCGNIQFDGHCVYTNTPVSGAFRGYGGVQARFAVESQIDELCARLQMDPVEFRLQNRVGIGDLFKGSPILSCGLADCIRLGAERMGWKEKRRRPKDPEALKSKGVGMACAMWVSGSQPTRLDATTCLIKVNEDGTAHLLLGCTDAGTGSKTTLGQICAAELGIRFEDLQITYGDTDVTPFDVGSHASRTCYVAGGAVQRAAADVKAQILEEAAKLLEAHQSDLDIQEGTIYVKGTPVRSMPLREVALAAHYRGRQFIGRGTHPPHLNPPSFGAQFAEVEVDRETGQVRVLSFVAAQDSGRAINPSIVRGHLLGGIQQGIGFALTEELGLDESGRAANPNFADYKILTTLDMPPIELILVETLEPSGPFGAKGGLGEAAMLPTAPAIANAIFHATGVRMRELPMTPERVFFALRDREEKGHP